MIKYPYFPHINTKRFIYTSMHKLQTFLGSKSFKNKVASWSFYNLYRIRRLKDLLD